MPKYIPVGPATLSVGGVEIGVIQPGTLTLEHEPTCVECGDGLCQITYEFTLWPEGTTDAGRKIHRLPPIRFPKNRAGQLGNKCVRALRRSA